MPISGNLKKSTIVKNGEKPHREGVNMLTNIKRPVGVPSVGRPDKPTLCELCEVEIARSTCIQCDRKVCDQDGITFGDPNHPETWYTVCVVCVEANNDTEELMEVEF